MTDSTISLSNDELNTPLGKVFRQMIGDPEFAGAVADDPDVALKGTGVDESNYPSLVHDGALLAAAAADDDVAGFNVLTNNENITSVLTNNENITSVLTNNENITSFLTPGRIRLGR